MAIVRSTAFGNIIIPESDNEDWGDYGSETLDTRAQNAVAAGSALVDGNIPVANGNAKKIKDSGVAPASLATKAETALLATKVEITNMVTAAAALDTDDIVLGNAANKTVKKSGLTIAQLKDALDPLGIPKPYMGTTAPTNYVLAMSQTIGATGSGATYAGAAYASLYAALWINAGGVGSNTSKLFGHWMTDDLAKSGVDAATDFAAGRTITMDYRGAVLRAIGAGVGWTEKTETNANVNAKQDDSYQGHNLQVKVQAGTYVFDAALGTAGGAGVPHEYGLSATSGTGGDFIASEHFTDGTNGTPRTAKETRMKNIGVNIIFRYQ